MERVPANKVMLERGGVRVPPNTYCSNVDLHVYLSVGCSVNIYRFTGVPPVSSDHIGYIIVVNHLLLTQLGSDMSLDVFLSLRRCPKHPNTPPFDFDTPIA